MDYYFFYDGEGRVDIVDGPNIEVGHRIAIDIEKTDNDMDFRLYEVIAISHEFVQKDEDLKYMISRLEVRRRSY